MDNRSLFRKHKVIQRKPSYGEMLEKEALIKKMKKREEEFSKRNPGKDFYKGNHHVRAINEERKALDSRLSEYMNNPNA